MHNYYPFTTLLLYDLLSRMLSCNGAKFESDILLYKYLAGLTVTIVKMEYTH